MKYPAPTIPAFRPVAAAIRRAVVAVAEDRVAKLGEAEAARFRAAVEKQAFPAFHDLPLSPAYKARKVAAGGDPRVMIASGHYASHVRAFRVRKPDGTLAIRVGLHPALLARDVTGRVLPVQMAMVAAVQEYGSAAARVPARPHWRPFTAAARLRAAGVADGILSAGTAAAVAAVRGVR